jgi:hypothetical protein
MRRLMTAIAAIAIALLAAPSPASADFGFEPGSVQVQALDAADQVETRAGAHPDRIVANFAFTATPAGEVEGNPKDVIVDLPAGFLGDPHATPKCSRAAFSETACAPETQVGVTIATFAGFEAVELPIYNVVPEAGHVAEFGFTALILPIRLVAGVRADGDYGTRIEIHNVPQEVPMLGAKIELWGVPADHQVGTSIPRKPFLTNSTRCDGAPVESTIRMRSWQETDNWQSETATGTPLTGCDSLALAPTLTAAADSPNANTPSGMSIDLELPQSEDPDGLVTPHVRGGTVTLPEGFTLSPAVAQGLTACSEAQLAVGSMDAPSCPLTSKVGTVELVSPALAEPLQGEIYIGQPAAGDPFRLFLTARGPSFVVKLRSSLKLDPTTGRLTTVLSELPQLPFSRLTLRFKDGPRAPLATPVGCGTGTATAALTSWAGGPPATATATVTTSNGPGGGPCLATAPFAPSFVAGTTPPFASAGSAFSTVLTRRDVDQALERLTIALPPGLAARLTAVERCSDGQAATASCPVGSRIGSVSVAAGAGPAPLPVTGDAYITGPYRGAPFGLALELRAKFGPFDFGAVVVRAALNSDPFDAHLTVVTDPLPQMLNGVPLRLRRLSIAIDRPGFMINPTSCRTTRIAATVTGVGGAVAKPTSRFAIGRCNQLRFGPRIAAALSGSVSRPALELRLQPRAGQANMRNTAIKLPRMIDLELAAVSALCTRAQALASACPAGSRVGSVRARTPLLAEPLTGAVNVVLREGVGLPELWASLQGGGLRLIARAETATLPSGQLRTTLVQLPDVPLSELNLRLRGGSKGLLLASQDACSVNGGRGAFARFTLRAQNGARRSRLVRVRPPRACGRAQR